MRMEHWWFTARLRLRSLLRHRRVEQEMDEELLFHLEHKIDEGIASGLSPDEARYRALRAMGGLDQRREQIRDTRRVHWLRDFVADVRYAVRSLRRTSGLAAFVAVTLALGIGMTAATFSMVDALVFRPYPVPRPSRIVTLVSTSQDSAYSLFSYREYLDLRAKARSYTGLIANGGAQPVGFSAEPGTTPRVRGGMLVSGNYFDVLGVQPQLGRAFRQDEDEVPGRDAVVLLGPDFWRHEFGADPSIVGRKIRLNGTEFTVIGVAPDTFGGMQIFTRPDLYMPLAMAPLFSTNPQKNLLEDRDDRQLSVKGRLADGVTTQQAQSEVVVLAQDLERAYPAFNRGRGAAVRTQFEMRTQGGDENWKFGVIFLGLALAVLLVACTNVAGLLLSRARTRTREIAVRLALGAGRFRLVRLLLTESLMLACLGGLGGVLIGYGVIEVFHTLAIPAELPVTIPFQLDTRVLLACLGLSLSSAFLCGLVPALQSTRADLVNGLQSAEVEQPGRKRMWGRNVLVVAQVSTSLMLLTASFLMVRGFEQGVQEGLGFPRERLALARFDPRLVQYDAAQTQRFYERLTDRMRAAPGVRSAALMRNPPLSLSDFQQLAFVPDGFVMPRTRESFSSTLDTIDEKYFETTGIAIVRGRAFLRSDTADAPRVAIVNEQFANHYWPGADAVGKRIRLDNATGTPVQIVGVSRTVKYRSTSEKPTDIVYLPLAQHPVPRMTLLVRSEGDPLAMLDTMKDVVRAIDPNLPLLEARTYEDLYRYSAVDGPQIAINLVGTMGVVALVLAVAGLYGLVAYNVSRRTREIGIRIAIGAGPSDVVRLVMGNGLLLVGTGTAIGLAMGFAVEQLMNSMLFDAGGVDVAAYLLVVPTLFIVTTLATYLPARRAARIAPTQALRYD